MVTVERHFDHDPEATKHQLGHCLLMRNLDHHCSTYRLKQDSHEIHINVILAYIMKYEF